MAIKILDETNNVRIYEVDGVKVRMEVDETDCIVRLSEAYWDDEEDNYLNGKSIGTTELKELDGGNHYITLLELDGCEGRYIRKGLGREALKFFKEYMGTKIFAADNDGQVRDDGSHLTNGAPIFIEKMREESIIEPTNCDLDD